MASQSESRLRVLVDANILVAGSVWPRWPYEVLRHAALARFQLVLSPLVIQQAKTRIQLSFPDSMSRFEDILSASDYEPIPEPAQRDLDVHSDLVRDPTDVPIAVAAINAGVDILITQDKDFTEAPAELHRRLKILLPAVFLRDYMGWMSEALEAIRYRNWE